MSEEAIGQISARELGVGSRAGPGGTLAVDRHRLVGQAGHHLSTTGDGYVAAAG